MLFYLSILFSFFALCTSILVIISTNPVHSVFFLILSFISICGNIFLLELEFLPLLLVIVYVGAISILFLFIVIMLDIKFITKEQTTTAYIITSLFLCFLFFSGIFRNTQETFFLETFLDETYISWLFFVDKFGNLNTLGQHIFSDFIVHFLIVGLILLVSIFGAVVLTIQLDSSGKFREQHFFSQTARSNLESFYLTS